MYLAAPLQIRGTKLLFMAGTAAILTKLASAPFHRWFLEIVPKVEVKTSMVLITWQKLAPIYILMFMIKTAVFISLLASGILGRVIQIIKNKLLEIIALSSIFNLRWIILARTIRTQRLFLFTITYWLILLIVIMILIKIKLMNRSINSTKIIRLWTAALAMARLAGLPPTIGFYAKVQVVTQALKSSIKEVVTILLVIRATNFYIYLRIISPRTTHSPTKSQKTKEKTKNLSTLIILINLLPLVTLTI
jgi:NADH:ubiquinone oxidoreductase subunit 2 (subunit N)